VLPGSPSDQREFSRLMALSQVGLEMVAPIGVGLGLDLWLGWLPWATLVGVVLGLTFSLMHLFNMVKRANEEEQSPPRRPEAP
jgi:hypothetical protein